MSEVFGIKPDVDTPQPSSLITCIVFMCLALSRELRKPLQNISSPGTPECQCRCGLCLLLKRRCPQPHSTELAPWQSYRVASTLLAEGVLAIEARHSLALSLPASPA